MTALIERMLCAIVTAAVLAFGCAPAVAAEDDTVRLLQTLSNAPGPSGFEEAVRKIMVEEMKPLADTDLL